MAKKSRAQYTSKGQRVSVRKDVLKANRRDRSYVDRKLAQFKAHAKGKPTYLTHKKGEYDPKHKIDASAEEVKNMGEYKMINRPNSSA